MYNLFKKIHIGEQKTLQCKHMFHSSCIRHWASKTQSKTETFEFRKPIITEEYIYFKKVKIYLRVLVVELNIHMMSYQVKLNVFLRKFI